MALDTGFYGAKLCTLETIVNAPGFRIVCIAVDSRYVTPVTRNNTSYVLCFTRSRRDKTDYKVSNFLTLKKY